MTTCYYMFTAKILVLSKSLSLDGLHPLASAKILAREDTNHTLSKKAKIQIGTGLLQRECETNMMMTTSGGGPGMLRCFVAIKVHSIP